MTAQPAPHALYRFYDTSDRLLYVGITLDLGARWNHHSKNKPWWLDVSRCTVDHYQSRETVLAAEKAAIIAEKPLHNIQHNQRKAAPTVVGRSWPGEPRWTYRARHGGHEFNTPLWLYWEVHCDPINDDYYVDEISSEELWYEWVRRYPSDPEAEQVFGPGAVSIDWYVEGPNIAEAAPLQDLRRHALAMKAHGLSPEMENFLTHFTPPYNSETDDPIRWAALPVIDKVWRERDLPKGPYSLKGGFIQEATGWKPSAFQQYVNVEMLAEASGLARPSTFRN